MTKKPEYADKITFQGPGALADAIRCLYKGEVDSTIGWKIYRMSHTFQPIKLSDVYRTSPKLIGCKKNIREVGERINDILNSANIDYKKADFISSSNLYTYPSRCYGRPHIQAYTDEDMFLVDFIKEDEIIIRNSDNEEIHFKLEGTYFYDDFRVKKITELNEEQINEDITYKSFKNEDNTYLSIKKYKNRKITDEITIKKGKIKINKFLNNDVSYKLYGNIKGNIDSWEYKGDSLISYNEFGKNINEKHFEIRDADSESMAMEMCKKVSEDVNN